MIRMTGDWESRKQPANPGWAGKWSLKRCVCVYCHLLFSFCFISLFLWFYHQIWFGSTKDNHSVLLIGYRFYPSVRVSYFWRVRIRYDVMWCKNFQQLTWAGLINGMKPDGNFMNKSHWALKSDKDHLESLRKWHKYVDRRVENDLACSHSTGVKCISVGISLLWHLSHKCTPQDVIGMITDRVNT